MSKIILPGAWTIDQAVSKTCYTLFVPDQWKYTAQRLSKLRAQKKGKNFENPPIYSLEPFINACFPNCFYVARNSWTKWDRGNNPWIWAFEETDTELLAVLVKLWLQAEFTTSLGEEANELIDALDDADWQWEKPSELLLNDGPEVPYADDIRYQSLPFYLAQTFLENPIVQFGEHGNHRLTFYRVARTNQSELMSWPPQAIPGKSSSNVFVSFALKFSLQTVPNRQEPIIYHHLSLRRWRIDPIPTNKMPRNGLTGYLGGDRRWLGGEKQPFCFVPLSIKKQQGEVQWPDTVTSLFSFNNHSLKAEKLTGNPQFNWNQSADSRITTEAAIAYDSRQQSEAPCQNGVSPHDFFMIDQAVEQKLPVKRVGEAVCVKQTSIYPNWVPEENWKKEKSFPLGLPEIASYSLFRDRKKGELITILILYKTESLRDALIGTICDLLQLSHKEDDFYQGKHGTLRIQLKHAEGLTEPLESTNGNNNQAKKVQQRAKQIQKQLQPDNNEKGLKGALVEIPPKPKFKSELDPKLAIRIGMMKAGYPNQHVFELTGKEEKEMEKSNKYPFRLYRAVSDLLRQWGILPTPLISEKDQLPQSVLLVCAYVLRRTKATTTHGKSLAEVLITRVDPVLGTVEVTDPTLFPKWVPYSEGIKHLLNKEWDYKGSEEKPVKKEEQEKLNNFLGESIQSCLNKPVGDEKKPQILFMVEAQNARKCFPWLKNPLLPKNDLPEPFKKFIQLEDERNRIIMARLRSSSGNEVPRYFAKGDVGARWGAIYRWEGICDNKNQHVYLSAGKRLTTQQGVLNKNESRLDTGEKPSGNTVPVEITVVHHPNYKADQVAQFVHQLRNRWPYFRDEVSLPFPFPFAIKAKEYAVGACDIEENGDEEESS